MPKELKIQAPQDALNLINPHQYTLVMKPLLNIQHGMKTS